MSVLHADYGRVWQMEEPSSEDDIKISPALELLIDSAIIDLDHGIDWDYRTGDFTLELDGPWSGSDYSGDDVNESNQRSLARDFPDLLIDGTQGWAHSGYGLQIEPDFGLDPETAEHAMELAKTLCNLKYEYPVYDEEDHWKLIEERAEEAWYGWLRSDTESEVRDLTGLTIDLDSDQMRNEFWELLSKHDINPEAEGHRDVRFPGVWDDVFLLDLARRAVELNKFDQDDTEDLTNEGFNVLGSVIAAEYEWPLKGQMTVFDVL